MKIKIYKRKEVLGLYCLFMTIIIIKFIYAYSQRTCLFDEFYSLENEKCISTISYLILNY